MAVDPDPVVPLGSTVLCRLQYDDEINQHEIVSVRVRGRKSSHVVSVFQLPLFCPLLSAPFVPGGECALVLIHTSEEGRGEKRSGCLSISLSRESNSEISGLSE